MSLRSEVWGDGGWVYIAHNAPYYNIVFANNDLTYQSTSFHSGHRENLAAVRALMCRAI